MLRTLLMFDANAFIMLQHEVKLLQLVFQRLPLTLRLLRMEPESEHL